MPLTPDTLESAIPLDCKTISLYTSDACLTNFAIIFRQPTSLGTFLRIDLLRASLPDDAQSNNESSVIKVELFSELNNDERLPNNYQLNIEYYCTTDKCNSIDNIKLLFRATMISFDYSSIMDQLYDPTPIENSLPCLTYSNVSSIPTTKICQQNSSSALCIKCGAFRSQESFCGGCYMYDYEEFGSRYNAYLRHQQQFWLKNTKYSFEFESVCNTPNCNSIQKQMDIKSLYTFQFDTDFFSKLATTTTTSSTTAIAYTTIMSGTPYTSTESSNASALATTIMMIRSATAVLIIWFIYSL